MLRNDIVHILLNFLKGFVHKNELNGGLDNPWQSFPMLRFWLSGYSVLRLEIFRVS